MSADDPDYYPPESEEFEGDYNLFFKIHFFYNRKILFLRAYIYVTVLGFFI